jgi:hypothetical protein
MMNYPIPFEERARKVREFMAASSSQSRPEAAEQALSKDVLVNTPASLSRSEVSAKLQKTLSKEVVTKQDVKTEAGFDLAIFSSFLASHENDMKTLKQTVSEERLEAIVTRLVEARLKIELPKVVLVLNPVFEKMGSTIAENRQTQEKFQEDFLARHETHEKRLGEIQAQLEPLDTKYSAMHAELQTLKGKLPVMQTELDDLTSKVDASPPATHVQTEYSEWFRRQEVSLDALRKSYVSGLAEHSAAFKELLESSEKAVDDTSGVFNRYEETVRKAIEGLDSAVNKARETFETNEAAREADFKTRLEDWGKAVDEVKLSIPAVVTGLGQQVQALTDDVDLLALEPNCMGYLCQKMKREPFRIHVMPVINQLNPTGQPLRGLEMKKLCMKMIESPPKYAPATMEKLKNEGPDTMGDNIYEGIPRAMRIEDLKNAFEGSMFDPNSRLFFETIVMLAGHLPKIFPLPTGTGA